MEGNAKKCVERYCELANKTTQQLYKVATPCMMTINLKKKKIQRTPTILRLRSGTFKRNKLREEPVAQNKEAWEQPLAHGASSSVDKECQTNTEATWRHYLQVSPHTSQFPEAVFSIIRDIYGRKPGDPVNENLAIWWTLMNITLRAAVRLGKDRIISGKQQDSFSGKRKSWSVVRQKSLT